MRKLRNPKAGGDPNQVLIDLYNYVAPSEVVVTTDYTDPGVAGIHKIVCNNTTAITIDLTDKPKDLNKVQVIRANTGAVTIDGNGNNINGSATYSIASQYDSVTVEWFEEIGRWIDVHRP